MRYDQTVKVYLLLDKYKKENKELKEQLNIFKNLMLYYKKYVDAVYDLIILKNDVSEFRKWVKLSFGLRPGSDTSANLFSF